MTITLPISGVLPGRQSVPAHAASPGSTLEIYRRVPNISARIMTMTVTLYFENSAKRWRTAKSAGNENRWMGAIGVILKMGVLVLPLITVATVDCDAPRTSGFVRTEEELFTRAASDFSSRVQPNMRADRSCDTLWKDNLPMLPGLSVLRVLFPSCIHLEADFMNTACWNCATHKSILEVSCCD